MTEPATTSRAVWWGLAAYLLAVAVVVFSPVSYSGIIAAIADWLRRDLGIVSVGSGWIEFVANILLFVPLGFLLTLLTRHHWRGAAIAIVLSIGVEVVQVLLPSRMPSVRDVIANGLGAAVGAAIAWLAVVRRRRREQPPRD